MAWFRLYDDVLDDPKVQILPTSLFKSWINLLCLANRHGGILPDIVDIAFALRTSTKVVEATLQSLKDHGLFEQRPDCGNFWAPHNWNGRQYKTDVSTGRVRAFRKRHETVSRNAPEAEQNRAEQKKGSRPVDNSLALASLAPLLGKASGLNGHRELTKAEKKVAWEGKVATWLCQHHDPERANAILDAYRAGEGWAKEEFERADKLMRAARRSERASSTTTWRARSRC